MERGKERESLLKRADYRGSEKARTNNPAHPTGLDQLAPKLVCGVVKRKLLTAQVIDRWVSLQVQEKIIIKAHLFRLLL